MSYLDSVRAHFSGRFLADVSTVNNHPAHYENAAFNRTRHWQRGTGGSADHGWWHPEGSNQFTFQDVLIRTAFLSDGSISDRNNDGIYKFSLTSRDPRGAKLVDLDPDQQLVSMIFGLRLAFIDNEGIIGIEGEYEPAPFSDLWRRGLTGSGDEAGCAFYQSVLKVTSWGNLDGSLFLQELRVATTDNLLSIKFNVDGYSMNQNSPTFGTGRIVGTIGPATISEPKHWVVGRNLGAEVHTIGSGSPRFRTTSGFNYCVALHDDDLGKVRLDLGNALPVNPAGGPLPDFGKFILGCLKSDRSVEEISEIPYGQGDWYERTAGIVEVPDNRRLTVEETKIIENFPLCIILERNGQKSIVIEEPQTHVRADMFVARMNPGDTFVAKFHASRLGKPIPNATIDVFLLLPPRDDVQDNFPVSGLRFQPSVTCDGNGAADLTFMAADPGNPRFYYTSPGHRVHVDGQIYWVGYELVIENQRFPTANPYDFFSILVWNSYTPEDPPTWHGSIKDILTQYGNLYPWMTKFGPRLDLADYEQVAAARNGIMRVLRLPETDTAYMPVSRDLSESKKQSLLQWLENLGPDGKPRLGTEAVSLQAPNITSEIPAGGILEMGLEAKLMPAAPPRLLRYQPDKETKKP